VKRWPFLLCGIILAALVLSCGESNEPDAPSGGPVPVDSPMETPEPSDSDPPTPTPIPATPTATETPEPTPTPAPLELDCITRTMVWFERALVKEINNEREREGLPPLETHGCAAYVAQRHSVDMTERGFYQTLRRSPPHLLAPIRAAMERQDVPYGKMDAMVIGTSRFTTDEKTAELAIKQINQLVALA